MNSKLLLFVIAGLIVSSYYANDIFAEENNSVGQTQTLKHQLADNVPLEKILCSNPLHVLTERTNGNLACVLSSTAEKLGWILSILESQLSIETGTFAGECLGYCIQDFVITSEKIMYTQNGWDFVSDVYSELPEQSKEVSLSKIEWQKLIELVDFQKFNSLPDRIGCPGCTDNLVEWIEISDGEKTKKIEFEPEDEIPEIDNLVIILREMRNTASSSNVNKIIPTLDDFKNTLSEPFDIDVIFSKFGEPHDDIGSGIQIFVYELNDSTEIWIGYVDQILYVKYVDLDGNVLEELFENYEN